MTIRTAEPRMIPTRAPQGLTRDPLRHALDRIRTRRRVGADMHAADRSGCERHVEALLQRQVGRIEVVVGAGIDVDGGTGGAPARAGHHLLAGARGRPVVLLAHQNQGGTARAPGRIAPPAAARKKPRPRSENPAARLWPRPPAAPSTAPRPRHWPSRSATR